MRTFYFQEYKARLSRLHLTKGELKKDFGAHQHDFAELMIILSGQAVHSINNFQYKISSGDVYVLSSDLSHEFTQVDKLECINVAFDPHLPLELNSDLALISGFQALFDIEPLLRTGGIEKHQLTLNLSELTFVKELLSMMIYEYEKKDMDKCAQSLILSFFSTLCFYISRKAEEKMNRDVNTTTARTSAAAAYIHSHFREDLTIENIASASNTSTRHLRRIFKSTFGISPNAYIKKVKLDEARKMLKDSEQNITEIAFSCGFNDGNYFSKLFQLEFDVSPRDYRKAYGIFKSKTTN